MIKLVKNDDEEEEEEDDLGMVNRALGLQALLRVVYTILKKTRRSPKTWKKRNQRRKSGLSGMPLALCTPFLPWFKIQSSMCRLIGMNLSFCS